MRCSTPHWRPPTRSPPTRRWRCARHGAVYGSCGTARWKRRTSSRRRSAGRCAAARTPPRRRARSRKGAHRSGRDAEARVRTAAAAGYNGRIMAAAAVASDLRAPAARSDRWLFGPLPDLLLGCGLLYAIVFAAHAVAGPALIRATPAYLLPLFTLLFSAPHYGGTLVRVYDQRHDRRAYAVFSVWITLALCLLFLATLGHPLLGSVLFTLYL